MTIINIIIITGSKTTSGYVVVVKVQNAEDPYSLRRFVLLSSGNHISTLCFLSTVSPLCQGTVSPQLHRHFASPTNNTGILYPLQTTQAFCIPYKQHRHFVSPTNNTGTLYLLQTTQACSVSQQQHRHLASPSTGT